MKKKHKMRLRKTVSAILAASMAASVFTAVPVYAETSSATYTYDGYKVDYAVTNEWFGNQNVNVTLTNTSDESILNWALGYNANGEISGIWNGYVYSKSDEDYIIKNSGYNYEIEPYRSVNFGYTLSGNELEAPEHFELCSKRVDKTSGYDVKLNVTGDWGDSFQAEIIVTNTSDTALEAWKLDFDSNFDISDSAVNNTNGKYTSLSDEFVGIKRLNVFKFFEDTNMLLPVETFHDVENSRVYTHVDELGTYCLMDMEVWLENLGIEANEFTTASVSASDARSNNADEECETINTKEAEEKCLDVVFVVYPWSDMNENIRPELSYVSQKILKQAKSENISARIHYMNFLNNAIISSSTSLPYASTPEEAAEMSYRISGIDTRAFSSSDYPLYKSFKFINENLINNLQPESKRYCFIIDAFAEPQINSVNGKLEPIANTLKTNGFNLYFAYSRNNENLPSYLSLATDGICSEMSITDLPNDYVSDENIKRRYNFGDFAYSTIFANTYPTFTAVGWTQIELNSSLQQNYDWYQQNTHYNEFMDTDLDGLADYEEIKFVSSSGRSLIDNSDPNNVKLLNFAEVIELSGDRYIAPN